MISTTSFKYIKAPKETDGKQYSINTVYSYYKLRINIGKSVEQIEAEEALNRKRKANAVEEHAFGTYASAGGEKIVYRVKKPGAHGGYSIVTETSNSSLSREDLLTIRSKKKADRHCY